MHLAVIGIEKLRFVGKVELEQDRGFDGWIGQKREATPPPESTATVRGEVPGLTQRVESFER